MDDLKSLKPDWTNRRKVIKATLRVLSAFLLLCLIGATALAYFAKFTFYVSLFYTVFVACSFLLMLGIIGSYVFGAQWETKDFLNTLTNLVPDFNKETTVTTTVETKIEDTTNEPPT